MPIDRSIRIDISVSSINQLTPKIEYRIRDIDKTIWKFCRNTNETPSAWKREEVISSYRYGTTLQLASISSRHESIENIMEDAIIARYPIISAIYYTATIATLSLSLDNLSVYRGKFSHCQISG